MSRYVVIEGSTLGHGCCFDATVVDTTMPNQDYSERCAAVVCECFDMQIGQAIADAMNATEATRSPTAAARTSLAS